MGLALGTGLSEVQESMAPTALDCSQPAPGDMQGHYRVVCRHPDGPVVVAFFFEKLGEELYLVSILRAESFPGRLAAEARFAAAKEENTRLWGVHLVSVGTAESEKAIWSHGATIKTLTLDINEVGSRVQYTSETLAYWELRQTARN